MNVVRYKLDDDTWMKCQTGEVVDTKWAYNCGLCVIRNSENDDAHVFHGYDIPSFYDFVLEAQEDFGDSISNILLRGCTDSSSDADEKLIQEVKKHRAAYLEVLKELGFNDDVIDVNWSDRDVITKIVYSPDLKRKLRVVRKPYVESSGL